MERKRKQCVIKIIAFVLTVSLLVPVGAQAAMPETVQPMASAYLMAYNAYICAMGNGDLEIWFRVTGTDIWADIGVLTIYLYESSDNENWEWVTTFLHEHHDTMLAHDTYFNFSHVDYEEGIPGHYYKAYVCIWAGPEDGGDARYMWTEVEVCT